MTGPRTSGVNTRFIGNTTAAFPQTKNVTSIETFSTTPIISPPKEFYEPTIETHRALVAAPAVPMSGLPAMRPSTPPGAGFGYNRGGMCSMCCPCLGMGGNVGSGFNPGMNMGMGMNTGGCCSGLCGGGTGGGMCGGGPGGCCGSGGMGMGMGGRGCCRTCCPFGSANMGMGGMGMPVGPSPMMSGGITTPGITSTTGFVGPITPGIGMTPGFGGGMHTEYRAGVYGPGLGNTGCCFCPECMQPNGCCACLSSPDCCCPF